MQSIKTKDVLVYATMPRILPRVKNLFSSGFAYVAFLMAHIYFMVRILPVSHPYLAPENIGRFGVRHVIVEASRNLKFSVKNIDQLLIYFALLVGILMLVAQFFVFVYAMIISPAMAFSWFDTPNPATDIAFTLLDRVFGIPDIFCSSYTVTNCTDYAADTNGASPGAPTIPLPFHVALHGLFRFYSTALLMVAVLIFLYFVVVVILETATSGTPFGQRFQNVWVPIRLVVALGLLMPVSYGLGSGQYIVLYAAKYGSGFATTGWKQFNDGIASHSMFAGVNGRPTGERYSLLAIPEAPDITPVIEAMSIVHACAYAYHRMFAGGPNQVHPSASDHPDIYADYTDATYAYDFFIQPWFVKKKESWMVNGIINTPPPGTPPISGTNVDRSWLLSPVSHGYMDGLGFYYGGDIIIRFGQYGFKSDGSSPLYEDETGQIRPFCGDIRIPVVDLRDPGGASASPSRGGADAMLEFYYQLILDLWFNDEEIRQFARSYIMSSVEKDAFTLFSFCQNSAASGTGSGYPGFYSSDIDCASKPPSSDWKQEMIDTYQEDLEDAIIEAWSNYVVNSTYEEMDNSISAYGWAGAGIWYNKIAEVNGGWMASVAAMPTMDRYPLAMEQVLEAKKRQNEAIEYNTRFDPTVKAQSANAAPERLSGVDYMEEVAKPLALVYSYWNESEKNFDVSTRTSFKNIFMDALNRLMGTGGLAAMRTSNAHLHPLAQLVMVGKGLVDSAVINLAGSTGSAFLGGLLGAFKGTQKLGKVSEAFSQVLLSTAFMGLTAGFVLFYVLPFLPFVYFYFAVASWIKSIFEAMVGVPLWALAHLRIDGDGLPGDSAQNGYFMILEIFIRPILTVVGLVAAVIIFSTQVRILNLLWDLVVANTSGHSPTGNDILGMSNANDSRFNRGIIDQFFFTVIYVIICYMMALTSFKLIDKIPDNILRWAGSSVSSFGDINQDQIESLNRYAAMGGMTIGNQAAGAIVKAGGGVGGAVGQTASRAT